jgi:acyl-coenzyme A thioesterase PaaI-like protein
MSELTERRRAVADLGTAMRETIVLAAVSEVEIDALARAAELMRQASALLAPVQRPAAQLPSVDELEAGIRYFSPVIGAGNAMSPPLQITADGDRIVARVALDRRFEGPPGFVHGGVTALLFDEMLGQAATHLGYWGMTANLAVSYRRPVPLDTELMLTAHLSVVDGRKFTITGTLVMAAEPERVCAEATGLFIEPRPETQERYFADVTDTQGADISGRQGWRGTIG